jgi:multiple sugar transport system permease protein
MSVTNQVGSPAGSVASRRWGIRATSVVNQLLVYVLVIPLGFLFAAPLLWMISTSLKTDPQVYTIPPVWIPNPMRFRNYPEALVLRPFGLYFMNTLRYAIPTVIGAVVSNALVAYGFAKIEWPGREALFFMCLATMMIPFQVRMIPLYVFFSKIHWVNSYKPLVVPTFFGAPYSIFMLRQFFLTIPFELSDAARVDGCSELGIFFRIILPLTKPALAVVALFQFRAAWNNYIGPLIYLNRETLFPVALGVQQFRSMFQERNLWPYMMSVSTVVVLPPIVIFFLTQRTFIEGISVTGMKG